MLKNSLKRTYAVKALSLCIGACLFATPALAFIGEGTFYFLPWTLSHDGYTLEVVEGQGAVSTTTDPSYKSVWMPRFAIQPDGDSAQWLVDCALIDDVVATPQRQVTCFAYPQTPELDAWSFVATAGIKEHPTGYLHDGKGIFRFETGPGNGLVGREARLLKTIDGTTLITLEGFSPERDATRLKNPLEYAEFSISETCESALNIPCPALALLMAGLHQLKPPLAKPSSTRGSAPDLSLPDVSDDLPASTNTFIRQAKDIAPLSAAQAQVLANRALVETRNIAGRSPAFGPDARFGNVALVLDVLGFGIGGYIHQGNQSTSVDLSRPGTFHYPFEIALDLYDFVRVGVVGAVSFSHNGGCAFEDVSNDSTTLSCDTEKRAGKFITPDYLRAGVGSDLTLYRGIDWALRVGADYSFATMYSAQVNGRSTGIRIAFDAIESLKRDRPQSAITTECRVGRATFDNPIVSEQQVGAFSDKPTIWEADCRVGIRLGIF